MLRWKSHSLLIIFVVLIALSGCSILAPQKQLLSSFEKIVEHEEEFNEQQKPLVELEKKEKEIYDEIMSLGMKEFSKIVKLSKKGLDIIEKRKKRIHKEYESIQSAKQLLRAAEMEIELYPDDEIKKEALSLVELLEKRYETYDQLYNHYQRALELETELYRMFQNKHLTIEQLERQVSQINLAYDDIMKTNEQFNHFTLQFNKAKQALFNKLN
jgi:hypothetical protein